MIRLRSATFKDIDLYFQWVNDEAVRKNSFNQNKIEVEQHKRWFEKKINDPNCLMFIASIDEKDVGQIRFEKINDYTFEIDFSVEKNFRGKGIGSMVIKTGTVELFKINPLIKRVIGKVKKDNISSKKSFLNAGFALMEKTDNNSGIDIYYLDNK